MLIPPRHLSAALKHCSNSVAARPFGEWGNEASLVLPGNSYKRKENLYFRLDIIYFSRVMLMEALHCVFHDIISIICEVKWHVLSLCCFHNSFCLCIRFPYLNNTSLGGIGDPSNRQSPPSPISKPTSYQHNEAARHPVTMYNTPNSQTVAIVIS